jgi:hypothetical protein
VNRDRHIIPGVWCPDGIKRLPYAEFLRTPYWKMVAAAVRKRANEACEMCASRKALQVHHKTYVNHGYEHSHLDDLICLCASCHATFHDKMAAPADPLRNIESAFAHRDYPKAEVETIKAVFEQLLEMDKPAGSLYVARAPMKRIAASLGVRLGMVSRALTALERVGKIKRNAVGILIRERA